MDPNIWGPRLWFSMHSISFTYPFYPTDKDKEIYKNFYKLLEYTLPCGLCRNNYKKHIEMFPIEPHLENPEPHNPQSNILDDSEWKDQRKKKIKIIFLNNFVFFCVLIFLIIILSLVYLFTK